MAALVIAGVCLLIAIAIVVGVWRFTRAKNAALHQSRMNYQRTKTRADAEQARAGAYQRVADRTIGLAEDAEANTRRALSVAEEIKKVSTQMDALMFEVANDKPRHGRHAQRALDDELGFAGDVDERYLP